MQANVTWQIAEEIDYDQRHEDARDEVYPAKHDACDNASYDHDNGKEDAVVEVYPAMHDAWATNVAEADLATGAVGYGHNRCNQSRADVYSAL